MGRERRVGLLLAETDSVGSLGKCYLFPQEESSRGRYILYFQSGVFTMRWESGICP